MQSKVNLFRHFRDVFLLCRVFINNCVKIFNFSYIRNNYIINKRGFMMTGQWSYERLLFIFINCFYHSYSHQLVCMRYFLYHQSHRHCEENSGLVWNTINWLSHLYTFGNAVGKYIEARKKNLCQNYNKDVC